MNRIDRIKSRDSLFWMPFSSCSSCSSCRQRRIRLRRRFRLRRAYGGQAGGRERLKRRNVCCPQTTRMDADAGPFFCLSASICVNLQATPDSVAALRAGPILRLSAESRHEPCQSTPIKANQGQSRLKKDIRRIRLHENRSAANRPRPQIEIHGAAFARLQSGGEHSMLWVLDALTGDLHLCKNHYDERAARN